MKLLYIEDDVMTQESMMVILDDLFSDIVAIDNPLEAIEIYKESQDFDIIITDITMPKMNGLELTKKIREINKNQPIIITSAHSEHEFFIESIKLKVDGYVLKPVDINQLINEIEKITETIKAKKESKRYSELLQQYKNAIDKSAIVSKTDLEGNITYVNDAFCAVSGYSKDELIGKNHNIIRHQDTPKSVFKALWATIKNKKSWKGVVKNRDKNGNSYYVDSNIMPLIDESGEVVEYIAIRYNITELELYKQDIEKELQIATKEIIDTQKEVVLTMGTIAEARSKETGLHVKRVAEYSYLLAKLIGLSEKESLLLKQASPMHDIGKVAISDDILKKPAKLTPEEFEIMKTHTTLGFEMLNHSNKEILKVASIVALQHHEKYDGSGYPNSLKGEDIHIYGRITAIADVFDALAHDRVYKKAWAMEDIFELLREGRGKHFDPVLVDIFFENIDKFLEIHTSMK